MLLHNSQAPRLQFHHCRTIATPCFICYILQYSVNQKYILASLHHVPISTAPTPPRMLTMTGASTGSTVELNWLPPLHPNGAIHYEIEYEPARMSTQPVNAGSNLYFTLTLPYEIETHRVTVVAVNSKGRARSNVLEVVVPPGVNTETGILHATCPCMLQCHNTTCIYMCAYMCMRECASVYVCMCACVSAI